jgi:hypothetical protein
LAGADQPLFLSVLSLMGYFGVLNNYEHYSLQIPSKRLGHNIPHSSCNGQNKHSQNFGQPIFLFTKLPSPKEKGQKKQHKANLIGKCLSPVGHSREHIPKCVEKTIASYKVFFFFPLQYKELAHNAKWVVSRCHLPQQVSQMKMDGTYTHLHGRTYSETQPNEDVMHAKMH